MQHQHPGTGEFCTTLFSRNLHFHYRMIWVTVQKLWTFRSTNVRTSWSQSIIIMHLRQEKWIVSWRKEEQIVSLSCARVHGIHLWWVSFRTNIPSVSHLPWHPEGLDSSSYNTCGETEREGEKILWEGGRERLEFGLFHIMPKIM